MKKTALFAAVVVLAAGCTRRVREVPGITYKTADPAKLVAAYNENAEKIPTLSAQLEMTLTYKEEGKEKQRTLDAWLDVEKPARLRLRHDALGRDLFYVVSNGTRYWVGLDKAISGGEDTVYTGTLAGLEGESLFRPDRLLAAFSLAKLPPAGTTESIPEVYNDRYVMLFLDGSAPGRVLAKATFSRVTFMLSRYEVFDEESRLALVVEYAYYTGVAGAELPGAVVITWPLDDLTVAAKVRSAKVGAELPPRLWEFDAGWRRDAKQMELNPTVTIREYRENGSQGN